MYEENDKTDIVEPVLSVEGSDGAVPVDVSDGDAAGDVVVDVPVDDIPADNVFPDQAEDVSCGDIFDAPVVGDLSADVIVGDVTEPGQVLVCSCVQKPLLWESDIDEYDTTDGLLLLILIFTILNTAKNWFGK